jgi:hypothetical protein
MKPQGDDDDEAILAFVRNHIFRDGSFKPLPYEKQAQICWPNRLFSASRPEGKIGALVSLRSSTFYLWPLFRKGLDYILSALDQKRIAAGVVILAAPSRGMDKVAVAMAAQVYENLRDERPLVEDFFGLLTDRLIEYYWVTRDFRVSHSFSAADVVSPDEEF